MSDAIDKAIYDVAPPVNADESARMMAYDFECGHIKGTVVAASLGAAWRKLTQDRRAGFARLARWRERVGVRQRRAKWKYQTPESLDTAK